MTGCPSAAQLTSQLNQGLILLKNPDANVVALWQTTLLIMIFLVAATAFNVFLARQLPLAEGIFLIVHIFGFFAFLIVLWIMSEHASASQVFGQFEDYGGWGNLGLSSLVGITTPLWCFLGPDAGAHMSEELKDASLVLPSAMMWASFLNAFFGLVMLITFCFCLGPDWYDNVLGLGDTPTATGIPIIQVLYASTNSINGTIIMTTILIILSMVGTITVIASSSRQVWAFARDKGFPFSSYIEHVSLSHLPQNSHPVPINIYTRSNPPPYINPSLLKNPTPKNIGPTRVGHPRQRPPRHPSPLPPHLGPQLRLRRRPSRHHQPFQRCPPLLLHTRHRLRPAQAMVPRALASPLLDPRPLGRAHQRCRPRVSGDQLCVFVFPDFATAGAGGHELGGGYFRVCDDGCRGFLFLGGREGEVCCARFFG